MKAGACSKLWKQKSEANGFGLDFDNNWSFTHSVQLKAYRRLVLGPQLIEERSLIVNNMEQCDGTQVHVPDTQ